MKGKRETKGLLFELNLKIFSECKKNYMKTFQIHSLN